MPVTNQVGLVSIDTSELKLAHPADDLRGLAVVDLYGRRVGEVDGLILDEVDRRARFLVVASGGILGLRRTRRLVPVDAVTMVDDDVHIEADHEVVHRSAEYDPELVPEQAYDAVYEHYGYPPFWGPGYVDPYLLRRL
jgi:sporulation protein YlmC with PRC-barrel domain